MIRKILTSSLITLVAVGGFFMNIERHESAISDTIGYQISGVSEAMAETPTAATPAADETAKKWNSIIDYLNMALGVLTFIVSPAIILASWLMSPDWTSGDLFGLRTVMHDLWITISNILYFIYAVLLIVIALATMFNQEKFGYKVMLPRLALGIILVPFTWWFVQWTISLASVVTASVVSIPTDTISKVMDSNDNTVWYNRDIIPQEITVSDTTKQDSFTKSTKCLSDGATEDGSSFCISPKKFLTNYGGMWSPLVIYAYGVFKFDKLERIGSGVDVIQAAIQLVHKGIIGALMFMVFGILVMALIFMLLMRAIKLWMYAIFSPLFTLHFVVGKDILGDKLDDFSLKEFIGLAFVPAVVGITLSFGLVIVSAIYNPITKNTSTTSTEKKELVLFGNPSNKIVSEIKDEDEKKISQTTVMIGDVKWIFKGSAVNGGGGTVFSALDSAGNSLGVIIVDIIALIFIWASFMAAKGVSKAVNAAVQPFEDMGKKIGALGMSLPKYAPILPPSMGGSVAGAQRTIDLSDQAFKSKMIEHEDEMIGKNFPNLVQGIIKESDRMKTQGAIEKTNDGKVVIKEIGSLSNGAKDNRTNLEKEYTTIVQAHKMDVFKDAIKRDVNVQTDAKLKPALDKFMDGKMNDLNEYEMKAINDYFRKASTSPTSQQTISSRVGGTGDAVNINIGGEKIQVDAKPNDTKVTEGKSLEKLKGKKAGMSKAEFIDSLTDTMKRDAAKDLADKIEKVDSDFFKT